jgi:cyclin D3
MSQTKHHQQQSPSFLDALLCQEQNTFEEDDSDANVTDSETCVENPSTKLQSLPIILLENDLFWEHDELVSLIFKEKETHLFSFNDVIVDGSLEDSRLEAVNWVSKVCSHYGFSTLTTVLAVNYFDRFVTSLLFQKDKPWMTQLTAVACLSLAAKMEETHVPLLLDLQVCSSFRLNSMCLLKCHFVLKIFMCVLFIRLRNLDLCLKLRLYKEWSFWCCLL